MIDLSNVSDDDLELRLAKLVAQERECTFEVVACLAELHRRHLDLKRGYSGLFYYCTKKLGYTPDQAMRRITAARLAVKSPRILDDLQDGRLTVSALRTLSPILNDQNRDSLLEKAAGLPLGEVGKLAAAVGGRPASSDKVMIVRPPAAPPLQSLPLFEGTTGPASAASPAAEIRIHFGFTGSEDLRQKLDRAKQVLWHKFPQGRLEDVIGQALDDLLDKRDPDRREATPRKPATKEDQARRRYIPVWVRAEVWKRDGGCCAFTTQDGVRCAEKSALEYDHVIPWALGGPSDEPDNIRLLCRAHNQLLARETFGEAAGRAAA